MELSENLIGFYLALFLQAEKWGLVWKFNVFFTFFDKTSLIRLPSAATSATFESCCASSEAWRAEQQGVQGQMPADAFNPLILDNRVTWFVQFLSNIQ